MDDAEQGGEHAGGEQAGDLGMGLRGSGGVADRDRQGRQVADVGGVDGADGDVDVVGDAAGMVEGWWRARATRVRAMSGAVVASLRRSAPEMCLPSRVARILMLSTGETLAEFLNSVQ